MTPDPSPPGVLIIGAGPAGLVVGHRLSQCGVRVQILERDQVGSTWRHLPDDLHVLSPWWTNVLNARGVFKCNPFTRVSALKFREHLFSYASNSRLDIREGVNVRALRKRAYGWCAIDDNQQEWSASHVVCATGYFSSPWMPQAPFLSDETIPSIHASMIEDYSVFAQQVAGKQVVLVGKRVTAGQLMVEMCHRDIDITLSANTPVQFRRSGLVGEMLDQIYFFYEAARIRFQQNLHADSYPVMDGGETERLISSGRVHVIPRPIAINNGQILLKDGGCVAADMVVFATGYRPALSYLEDVCDLNPETGLPKTRDFELVEAPGVFVIGLDNLRNFRSRYLRGIRSDAKVLANIIAARASAQRIN